MAAIDKAGAAERLVVSAILMAERGDDPLAIHVVAASALNVLRDLITKAGDDYHSRAASTALVTSARGNMPA